MENKKYKLTFMGSIVCFAISSMSFFLIPVSDFNGKLIHRILAYMVGGLFWGGLFVGLIMTAILSSWMKKDSQKKRRFPGILCFFRNKQAKRYDCAMFLIFVLFIVSQRILGLYHWISIILLSCMLMSIYMHSVLNGEIYAYIMQRGVRK
jgi:hypothetical protein